MISVRSAFADQAYSCRELGSELTAQVLETLGAGLSREQGEVAERVFDWQGDLSSSGDSVPLRLAGALHGPVLDGEAPELAVAYAEGSVSRTLLLRVFDRHQLRIFDWLERISQTNEVGRLALLIAGVSFALSRLQKNLPLALKALGASAGLERVVLI